MKCPICKQECEKVYFEQDLKTTARGVIYSEDEKPTVEKADITGGWSDLYDWIENMLTESGNVRIMGCLKCSEMAQ